MANFRVGQKVICVDPLLVNGGSPLVKGEVYTVRMVKKSFGSLSGNYQGATIGVLLEEAWNPHHSQGAFAAARFRPVHTIESDSEMFKRISEDTFGRLEVLEQALNENY